MERDIFFIHRILRDTSGYYGGEIFLCESEIKNEFETVLVNEESGKIFDDLRFVFEKRKSMVLFFSTPLCAIGHTVSETDCIPGPTYTKKAVDGKIEKT